MVKRMFFNLHTYALFFHFFFVRKRKEHNIPLFDGTYIFVQSTISFTITTLYAEIIDSSNYLQKKKWKKKKVRHWELNCWQFWQRKWLADFGFKPNRKPVGHCRRYLFSRSKSRICFRICLALSWSYLQIRIHMCSDEQPGDKECLHMEIFPGGS